MSEKERFVDKTIQQTENANRIPISGYMDYSACTLEESVEGVKALISSLSTALLQAKNLCNKTSTLLTHDESAAIYLYTMPTIFFELLNKVLRDPTRMPLKAWFPYIGLLISALEKLPSISSATIWRAVEGSYTDGLIIYAEGTEHIWWSFNSCTRSLNVVEAYVGLQGMIFAIECKNGKDVSLFSALTNESEVILTPGTRLRVSSSSFIGNNLLIIHMVELDKEHVEIKKKENYRNEALEKLIEEIKNDESACFVNIEFVLSDDDIGLITNELERNCIWKTLNLNGNEITNTGIFYISQALIDHSNLKSLMMMDTSIGDKEIIHLANAFTRNNYITYLDLSENTIGDRGVRAIAEMLIINSTLEDLYLNDNKIGDDGCKTLCEALQTNSTLQYLEIGTNKISTNSLEAIINMLKQNQSLKELDLDGNLIIRVNANKEKLRQAALINARCDIPYIVLHEECDD